MAEGFDLEAFRLRPGDVPERRRTRVKTRGAKVGDGFVMGPIPVAVLGRAYRAHVAGPNVMLAIKLAYDLRRLPYSESIPITGAVLQGFGISEDSRRRAIKALAVAGLLTVEWRKRRAPLAMPAPGIFE